MSNLESLQTSFQTNMLCNTFNNNPLKNIIPLYLLPYIFIKCKVVIAMLASILISFARVDYHIKMILQSIPFRMSMFNLLSLHRLMTNFQSKDTKETLLNNMTSFHCNLSQL